VIDRNDIGRQSSGDSGRRDDLLSFVVRFAFHPPGQTFSGQESDGFRIWNDARQRWLTELAKQFVVVDTNDGDFFRNGQFQR